YNSAMNQSWPVWMVLFGLYFPERFPAGKWRKATTLLGWVVVAPLSLAAVIGTWVSVRSVGSYQSVEAIVRVSERLDTLETVLTYTALAAFLAALVVKYFLAISRDAKRRLRIVYLGSFISLAPALGMNLVANARHTIAQDIFPAWFVLFALFAIVLFPLTFAYVIVVHKAMEVRVVLRQGLQYALAKNGVRVLQALASAIVLGASVTLATQTGRNRPQKIALIAVGFIAILLLRRGAERLRAWTDRRFFRDAYNAEQILTDLSDEVRTIVEPRTLLQTVSQRIAESLHIGQVAVLLNGAGLFKPAYALGFPGALKLEFPQDAVTVRQLIAEKQPARVYLDDPNSWVNRDSQVSPAERDRLTQLHAELLLPLSVRENLLGFISLGQKLSEEPYSGSDLRLLQSVAAQTGLALENARLTDAMAREMAQREKMNREIEIAREVQERLFPQQLVPIEGLDYCGACRPALGVGGDYYDFIALPGGKLGIAIGDVAGKGISAALMMASLQASLRGQAMVAPDDLARIVTNVNRLVFEASSANRYATFFYGQYDPVTRELSYVNAGHNPPVLLRKCNLHARLAGDGAPRSGDCECRMDRLEAGGMVVGLLSEASYQQGTIKMQAGDLLVAYTDGVSEAMNSADEEWSEERMLQALEPCDGLKAEAIIARVLKAADAFAAGAPQFDDMTLVVARAL
ncbi:MAG TPA: GAF domain-containing SpoIIE family protein phosphatase, partial [Bryobacteraceae bacterium]|nr:GAF domain-containing SpoIIE family protein phosphatase [Bryobacteraceae bacterium]